MFSYGSPAHAPVFHLASSFSVRISCSVPRSSYPDRIALTSNSGTFLNSSSLPTPSFIVDLGFPSQQVLDRRRTVPCLDSHPCRDPAV